MFSAVPDHQQRLMQYINQQKNDNGRRRIIIKQIIEYLDQAMPSMTVSLALQTCPLANRMEVKRPRRYHLYQMRHCDCLNHMFVCDILKW